ncbi:MAG: hypothetical protein ABI706_16530 [Ilumatobacteraceae bacterium]
MTTFHIPPVGRRWRVIAAAAGISALAGGGVLLAAPSDPATALAFHTVPTVRVLDTRPATLVGTRSTPLGLGDSLNLVIPGLPDDATGVDINVTAVDGTEGSFLTVYPTGDARPVTSTINWEGAGAVANNATVVVRPAHSVTIYNLKGTVNVVIDLLGYYAPSPAGGGTQGPPGPAGTSAFLYATSTSPQTVVVDAVVAFDQVNGETAGAFTTDVLDDAFTAVNAGTYKVSFGVASQLPAQFNLEVDGVAPTGGALVFGADGGNVLGDFTSTEGTAVVTLTAGQTITLANRSSATEPDLASSVGGTGPSISAWILIEKLS